MKGTNIQTVKTFLKIIGLTILGILALLIVPRLIRQSYEYPRKQFAAKQYGSIPSKEGLPVVTHVPVTDMLLVNSIGEYLPSHPYTRDQFDYTNSPTAATYSIAYSKKDTTTYGGIDVAVDVIQWPNIEWAHYKLRDLPFINAGIDFSDKITKVNKFNQTIYQSNAYIINVAKGGEFYWASGDKQVHITFYSPEVSEILEKYLSKYPSDLR